jgi:hypothetical protein
MSACAKSRLPAERLREEQTVRVLLNRVTADGIADGSITLVLRRWDTARAKAGGTQRTSTGTIRIDGVTEYPGDYRVTARQARAAGYRDTPAAQAALDRRPASTSTSSGCPTPVPTSGRRWLGTTR